MFDSLTDRLHGIFRKIAGSGKLTEQNINETVRQIRKSLLDADVHYKVAKDFIESVKSRAIGLQVHKSISPSQMLLKIVYQEMTHLLGNKESRFMFSKSPTCVMLVGLHGNGKTTTCCKLAQYAKNQSKKVMMVGIDPIRPAAGEQLTMLGKSIGIDTRVITPGEDMKKFCKKLFQYAINKNYDVLLFDTAGRWQIEDDLMQELINIKTILKPKEILLVADSTVGQDAVNIARGFNEFLSITGVVLTKIDGDSRGGAALSIRKVTGAPIKFLGTGEKPENLELFYPDRIASRILGMGDLQTLVEKVEKIAQEELKKKEDKKKKHEINLEDFLKSIRQIQKVAPMKEMLKLLPMGSMFTKGMSIDKDLKKIEAVIFSMTPFERRHPDMLDGSRKKRVAYGSGVTVQEVNMFLQRFERMKKTMKKAQKKMAGQMMQGGKSPFPFPFPPKI